jgi:hypothetical protein
MPNGLEHPSQEIERAQGQLDVEFNRDQTDPKLAIPHQRKAKDVGKVATLHTTIFKAIAAGDEIAAATAANPMIPHAPPSSAGTMP